MHIFIYLFLTRRLNLTIFSHLAISLLVVFLPPSSLLPSPICSETMR